MKKGTTNAWMIVGFATAAILLFSCSKERNAPNYNNNRNVNTVTLQTQINSYPAETLSEEETNSLLLMREEEKLARDVYITLYQKWGTAIFNNISGSEQTHMDALLLLFQKYSLTDPVGNNAVGIFQDPSLQELYYQLVAKGNVSLSEAFIVGATIEDLDIFDLTRLKETINNQDILFVYDMLTKGSRNHLRSFNKNILTTGATYTPQFIDEATFTAIINSPMETGF